MKHTKNSPGLKANPNIRAIKHLKVVVVCYLILGMVSCESFVDIDPPSNTLITETVFEDAATVESAMANIYYKMREQGMVSGNFGLSINLGIYADELDYYGTSPNPLNLYNHTIASNNATIQSWWNHAYNIIYAANDVIYGIGHSPGLPWELQNRCKGQALFVRAYMHSLLVGLYGDIPYITTTDYVSNTNVARQPVNTVYGQIIDDLKMAIDFMDGPVTTGERVIPNRSVAHALLSRMYLYTENWEKAEEIASKLISTISLEADINNVFLKSSSETIWQFKPEGKSIKNTQEAQLLIIGFLPTSGYAISNSLLNAFEPNDLRRSKWIGSITNGSTTLHFAHKYKETINSTTASLEYAIIFRVSEQYLIRAEARAHQNNPVGAQQDLNAIRQRAGLGNVLTTDTSMLIEAIIKERRVELFTEHGQRWNDLTRLGKVDAILSPVKTNWRATDILLPIPNSEIEINPNLKPQNSGY
jgi:hypothetical protein